MPERNQAHFHVKYSMPHECPVSYFWDLWSDYLRRIWPMCRRRRTYVRLHVGAIYFRSEPRINARRRSRSYFAGTHFVRAHDAGERRRIEFGTCSSCLIVFLGPNNEHLPLVGQRGVVGLHAIFCAIYSKELSASFLEASAQIASRALAPRRALALPS